MTTVAAERMNVPISFGQQGPELLPDRLLLMYGESAGTGVRSFVGKLQTLPT